MPWPILAPFNFSVPDTAYLDVKIEGNQSAFCLYTLNEFDEVEKIYSDFSGNNYSIDAGSKKIHFKSSPGNGSSSKYVGGFEIMVKDWEQLDAIVAKIEKKVEFIPSPYDELLKVSSIKENQRDIFVWLDFLDINVVIILVLMILIGIMLKTIVRRAAIFLPPPPIRVAHQICTSLTLMGHPPIT